MEAYLHIFPDGCCYVEFTPKHMHFLYTFPDGCGYPLIPEKCLSPTKTSGFCLVFRMYAPSAMLFSYSFRYRIYAGYLDTKNSPLYNKYDQRVLTI